MEPNKLENEIREKLGKREIQPSAQAWDRLDAMLSVQESKVDKKSFPWIRIAAGVVLFLGVSYFFFNSNKEEIKGTDIKEIIVESSKKTSDAKVEKLNEDLVESSNSIAEENNSSIAYNEIRSKDEKVSQKTDKIKKNTSDNILSTTEKENMLSHLNVNNEEKAVEEKIEQNIVQLSKQAVAEVKTSIENPKLKIDPNSLLDQVDGEIQLTFRQKVMKTVTKGYKEAKEAVASRNQESSINH